MVCTYIPIHWKKIRHQFKGGCGRGCAPSCVEHETDDYLWIKNAQNIRFRQPFLLIANGRTFKETLDISPTPKAQ